MANNANGLSSLANLIHDSTLLGICEDQVGLHVVIRLADEFLRRPLRPHAVPTAADGGTHMPVAEEFLGGPWLIGTFPAPIESKELVVLRKSMGNRPLPEVMNVTENEGIWTISILVEQSKPLRQQWLEIKGHCPDKVTFSRGP